MKQLQLNFGDTGAFSGFFLDYINRKESLRKFYHRFPQPDQFREQAAEKGASYSAEQRALLCATLERQYAGLEHTSATRSSLDALTSRKTFTVVTGHQLNLFTGPLYFIYKIVTAINACRQLKSQYPDLDFVPVYWMASEDHDFDEIKYFRLNGKKFIWNSQQTGAVGRFNLKDLQPLLGEVPGDIRPFGEAYRKSATLAEAARRYVHELFGAYGLLVIDGDDAALKRSFQPVMEADLFHGATDQLVAKTNAELVEAGYEPQVHVRNINLFHLDAGSRERIERNEKGFSVLNTDITFSDAEMREVLEKHPERFSPNVILRPLYQETVLPNLAYVGGPAENVYWLQLKGLFDHFKLPFPILLPRNFAMVMDGPVSRDFKKSGLSAEELFLPVHELANRITLRNTSKNLSTDSEQSISEHLYDELTKRAAGIDPTLEKFVAAQAHRAKAGLEKIATRLMRAERRRQEDKIRQALKVKESLFPGGGLQERIENILQFSQTDNRFIGELIERFDPFDFRFYLLFRD